MSFFIDFNSLNLSELNTLLEENNNICELISLGQKKIEKTILSNINTISKTSLNIESGTGTGTGPNIVIIENTNIQLIDSFTNTEIVQFYKDVLNAIDNMILLDYIRDYVMPQKVDTVNYFVTKTLDVNLDLALAYYAIKYPNDTSVDTTKLQELSAIIETFYSQV
jgi:hypothetical protein